MTSYGKAVELMKKQFSRDYQFVLATCENDVPTARFIDTYFHDRAFYAVTYATSIKMRQIEMNPMVTLLGRNMHQFKGVAYNIGHPLEPRNKEIREQLIKAFEPWYFEHNNEKDKNMRFLKIIPTSGFFHIDKIGYKVDFIYETVKELPFDFEITLTED